MRSAFALLFVLWSAAWGTGQTPGRTKFFEVLPVGHQYHVTCRVSISGSLDLPEEKGQKKQLSLVGTSNLDYSERILREKDKQVDRTIRLYRKVDFERKVGDQLQHSTLRPEVRRLVIMRAGNFEVPFCPTAPVTWGEIDLVRTDVFTPALTGLLPQEPVKADDTWKASDVAVKELTDLERLEEGGLTCTLEAITTLVGRQQARITFQGTVRGLGEDGGGRHRLDGYLLFDLGSNHISYLQMKGIHDLLDKDGKSRGKIEGTFVLTRDVGNPAKELSDEALRSLTLEPNEDNTLLLHEDSELGIRFLYPRRWRVAGTTGRQIAIDEKGGNGLLITVDVPGRTLTSAQFHQETRNWLAKEKAKVNRLEKPRAIVNGLEGFSADIEVGKQRLLLDYYVIRQSQAGATVAARILPAEAETARKDAERITRSIQFIQAK